MYPINLIKPMKKILFPAAIFLASSVCFTASATEAPAAQTVPTIEVAGSDPAVSDDVMAPPSQEMTPYEALFVMEQEETDITELREYCADEPAEIPVDFASLQAANPELYAWIHVDGTPIDYAVAQHEGEDQAWYLHRNIYGQDEFAGAIYTEIPNKKNFTSLVTVMYGHNMRNGSMFHGLHSFRDQAFFDEHEFIDVYTPEAYYTYRIFASYIFDDRHILSTIDMHTPELYEAYLKDIQETYSKEGHFREDITLDAESRILTLSTCVGGMPDNRCLLQAVLVKVRPAK